MSASMQTGPGGVQVAVPSMDVGGPAQWLSVQNNKPVITNSAPPVQSTQTIPGQYRMGGATNLTNTTPGTAGYGLNSAQYTQGINQEYNSAIQGDQNAISALNAWNPRQQADVNSLYGAQVNQARQQGTDALNTLETQRQGMQAQHQLGLAELADQIRGQNNALQNQLGSVGAGFSSAAGQGQYALARAQNMSRANIDQQANSGIAQVNAEKQATNDQMNQQLQYLDSWKQQQLDQIAQSYQNALQQYQAAMSQAQGEQKARLALYGQALTKAATDNLSALDAQVSNTAKAIQGQAISNPNGWQPQSYQAPSPISVQQVSPFTSQGEGNTTAQAPSGGSLYALLQKTNGQ